MMIIIALYLVRNSEKIGLERYKDPKAFIEYSNNKQDVYKSIEDYNPNRKCEVLIVFDDMIVK